MLGCPKYTYGDKVNFQLNGQIETGTVEIVDAYGTFFQTEQPSYDIMIERSGQPLLVKHVPESMIYT